MNDYAKHIGIKSRRGMEDFFRSVIANSERCLGENGPLKDCLTRCNIERLLVENQEKYRRLRAYGLPVFRTYGVFDTIQQANASIPAANKENGRFLVRCSPKNQFGERGLERTMGISWNELGVFVSQLTGGADQYTIEIRDYWDADYAGTIIANGKGFVLVEVGAGNHAELDKKDGENLINGIYDDERSSPWFVWSDNSTPAYRTVATNALRFFAPRIHRTALLSLELYTEFVYHSIFGFRFLDISTNQFWLKRTG